LTDLEERPLCELPISLPSGYHPGRRYPLITEVYPGRVLKTLLVAKTLFEDYPLSLALFAAHGYAVLLPSMPLQTPKVGTPNDVYPQLTKGVLPAVDKVIEMGIADPERLAVIGQSYGSYGVYNLITQTDRFKAAAALAGPSNLISEYGQFEALERYDRVPR